MKIVAHNGCFALLEGSGRDYLTAKEECGFKFNSADGVWAGSADAVKALRDRALKLTAPLTISTAALAEYTAAGKRVLSAIEESHAQDSDAVIPAPEGYAYLPFQRAGIAYATKRSCVLIGDEMGLGKTIQAIGVVNTDPKARSVLIVCSASLKVNWRREFTRWDIKGLKIQTVDGETETIFACDVVIINYDVLGHHREELRRRRWDVLICDEAHFLKTAKTDRTREVFGGIKRDKDRKIIDRVTPISALRVLLLTGTPIPNRPRELWPILQSIDPDGLGRDWLNYARRYCGGRPLEKFNPQTQQKERFGYWWDGADHLDELQDLMRSRFMVRRLKKDVLKDLPPKRRQIVVLEPKPALRKLIQKELRTYEEHAKVSADKDVFDVMPAFEGLSELRKEIAIKKVPYAVEHIKEALNETEKIVVWIHHHEIGDALFEAFADKAVLVDGRVSGADRQHRVDRFQNDSTCQIFIGSIQAAGVGITLTASSLAIFVELDWVPGNISQAEDRCHRIGQKDAVLIQHLVLEGSLDERMVELLIAKQAVIDAALDKPKIPENKGII